MARLLLLLKWPWSQCCCVLYVSIFNDLADKIPSFPSSGLFLVWGQIFLHATHWHAPNIRILLLCSIPAKRLRPLDSSWYVVNENRCSLENKDIHAVPLNHLVCSSVSPGFFWTSRKPNEWWLVAKVRCNSSSVWGRDPSYHLSAITPEPGLDWRNVWPVTWLKISSPSLSPCVNLSLLSAPSSTPFHIQLLFFLRHRLPSDTCSISFSPFKPQPSRIHFLLSSLPLIHPALLLLPWLIADLRRFSGKGLQAPSTHPPTDLPIYPAPLTPHFKGIISGRDQILKHDDFVLVFKCNWSCWFLIGGASHA